MRVWAPACMHTCSSSDRKFPYFWLGEYFHPATPPRENRLLQEDSTEARLGRREALEKLSKFIEGGSHMREFWLPRAPTPIMVKNSADCQASQRACVVSWVEHGTYPAYLASAPAT